MIRASVDTRVAMAVSGHKTRLTFDGYNITAERDIGEALERTERYRQVILNSGA